MTVVGISLRSHSVFERISENQIILCRFATAASEISHNIYRGRSHLCNCVCLSPGTPLCRHRYHHYCRSSRPHCLFRIMYTYNLIIILNFIMLSLMMRTTSERIQPTAHFNLNLTRKAQQQRWGCSPCSIAARRP